MGAVADHLHHDAVMFGDGRANQRIVPGECATHPAGVLLPQPRAALDVGEKNGE